MSKGYKAGQDLGAYAARYIQRYIIRSALRPLIDKLLPTHKHKLVAAIVLMLGWYIYSAY